MRSAAADLHPSSEDLRAFVLGTLAEDSGNAVEEHLAMCPDCQEAASAIPADTLVTLLRTVQTRLDSLVPTPVDGGNTLAWEPLPADPSVPPPALAAHPRYRLIRPLGSGGMGAVWLAEHTVMGRQVALKVIRPEHLAKPGAFERFRREVRAASRLHHSNIVAAHDAEQAGDCHFLVTEFVEGQSLAERVTWRAFRRHVLEGRSTAETAAELGLSLNSVLLAKSRVLKRLRAEMNGLVES